MSIKAIFGIPFVIVEATVSFAKEIIMTDLFLDRYRIRSTRKMGHDYTSPGAYFITINTDAKINWFGSVEHGIIRLSAMGEIVKDEWLKSAIVRNNIRLDEWIIMPNHIHGIIIIEDIPVETVRWAVSTSNSHQAISTSNTPRAVSKSNSHQAMYTSNTHGAVSTSNSHQAISTSNTHGTVSKSSIKKTVSPHIKDKNQYRTKTLIPNSIGSIIGQFKSVCTKKIRNRGHKYFKWQHRFYDHIIRDEYELQNIRVYIRSNPKGQSLP